MTSIDVSAVRTALDVVRDRISAAGGGDDVSILAVTKGFGPEAVVAAVAAGCTGIGENYAQELLSKRDAIAGGARPPEVHFIGQLQTNKVRQLVELVNVYETVDRGSTRDGDRKARARCAGPHPSGHHR